MSPASLFGERFISRRVPAWHALGTIFDDAPTMSSAFLRANLDYTYTEGSVYVAIGDAHIAVPDKKAILRSPTIDDPMHRVLSIVGKDFGVVQNMDIAKILDELTERWPVETAGALGYGETIFATMNAGEAEIGGESIQKFFLLTDSKDGSRNLDIAFTPVRVVCQNTLTTGLQRAQSRFALQHTRDVGLYAQLGVNVLAGLQASEEDILRELQELTQVHFEEDEAVRLIAQIYPESEKSRQHLLIEQAIALPNVAPEIESMGKARKLSRLAQLEHTALLRGSARELLARFNDEQPSLAWTAWALYNSVVELEDFKQGRGSNAEISWSALRGSRAQTKTRAYSLISRAAMN